jgi:hypothetical protein
LKKTAILFTILIIVATAAYLGYNKYYEESNRSIWEYVTSDAAFVFESNNTFETFDKLQRSDLGGSLNKLVEFKEIRNQYFSKDSTDNFSNKLLNGSLLISAHVTSNSTLGYTFFINLNVKGRQEAFLSLLEKNKKEKTSKSSSRVYQGRVIEEIKVKSGILSYFIDNNILVCSLKPFLVEDVIRVINGDKIDSFLDSNLQLSSIPKLSNDDGNVYVNFNNLNKIIQIFKSERDSAIEGWANNSFFDLSFTENKLFLNGFTLSDKNDFLNTFIDQIAVNDRFDYYIPTSASEATKYLTSDAKSWFNKLLIFWNVKAPDYVLIRNDFLKTYNYDVEESYSWIKDGLCSVIFDDGPTAFKLLYVSTTDVNQALNQLNIFAEKTSLAFGDSLYSESYGDYNIREIKIEDFPLKVFGPDYDGYETTYYLPLGGNIVFGNSIEVLKNLLVSVENEETWGRSVAYNNFFESGIEETNVSIVYNLQRMWPRVNKVFKPEWKDFLNKNAQALKSFKLASIQYSRVDDNFYTSVSLLHEQKPSAVEKPFYNVSQSLSFISPISTKPYVVKNHNTNRLEVIIQDSLNNLGLISTEGKKLWSTKIDDAILSDIVQIDYYNNKKLQYFFATKNSLYIIDRLGNKVDNYPIHLDYNIQYASVVDYDNSKKYRFLLNDDRGNLHLLNKEGRELEGWRPMVMSGKLSSKPFHIRVRGKDCIVALQQDGKLVAWNRRGGVMKGFPLQLDDRFDTDIFVAMGSDFSKTYLHILSRSGRLYKINLEGQIQSSEELYKQTKEARFQIVPDALKKSYIIARQETNRLVIVDAMKKEILEKDYLGSDKLKIQYYYFTPDNQIYVVTDPVQEFAYIYRSDGSLVNSTPIDSDKEVGILFSESKNQFTVYTVANDIFKLLSF